MRVAAVAFESADHFSSFDPLLAAVIAHRVAIPKRLPPHDNTWASVVEAVRGTYRFTPHFVMEVDGDSTVPGAIATFVIRGTGELARSHLYPLDAEGRRFATDIPEVFLLRDLATGALTVDWRGLQLALPEVPAGFRLPIDLVRAGVDDADALTHGIAEFRRLAADGALVDSRTEFALNATGFALLRSGRSNSALEVFRLQADLFPTAPNAFDSLGEALLAVGDTTGSRLAYERAAELDPRFRRKERR